jgi:hypothetical protein
MNLHPFFIIGNPEQHSLLRARGYETFEELFGVSVVSDYTQAMKLWHNIKNTRIDLLKTKIKNEYFDKLIHNQKLFLSRKISWNTIVDSIVELVN